MNDSDKHSRVNKFEKRRKNTKVISILMIVGALLLIVLILSWFFGGSNKDTSESSPDISETENNDTGNENNTGENATNQPNNDDENNHNNHNGLENNNDDEADTDNENNDETSENEEVEIKEVEVSDQDENIESAYTGNWQPIGTEQSEPHETQFDDETVDWEEMKQAIALASDLDADEMIIWRIGNDGEQKAVGTVSPSDNSETYRVYISWITDEGWKPTQVEILKENEYDE